MKEKLKIPKISKSSVTAILKNTRSME